MNNIIETEGIVLREINYGDTSKILRVFTKDLGKISILVRGATNPKSKNRVLTGLFSYSNLKLKRGRNFYYIHDGDLINSFYDLRLDLNKLSYGLYILELIDKSMELEQVNKDVFEMTIKSLNLLEAEEKNILKLITAYEIKYISIIGFMPQLKECSICGSKDLTDGKFSHHKGGVVCGECAKTTAGLFHIDYEDLRIINLLLFNKLENIIDIEIEKNRIIKIHNLILGYILESIDRNSFNSLKILDEI